MNTQSNSPESPLLSVTVTNYNYARFLPENIESILSQSFKDFELIIVDNASTDSSVDVINKYASYDPRIRVIAHSQNQGPLASFREACALSRGRYRVQVDADDWVISPTAFQQQIDLLEAHPRMTFAYASMTVIGDDGGRFQHRTYDDDTVLAGEIAVQEVLNFSLGHSGLMHRMDVYREVGGYPDGLKYYDDVLLAVRMCELGDVGYIDGELYAGRQHGRNEHLDSSHAVVQSELLPIIDQAFAGPLGARMPNASAVRRRVTKKALIHIPTCYIFANQRRIGWRLYWESVKFRPFDTVFQTQTLGLVARSVLGASGYNFLHDRMKRLGRSSRTG